MDGPPLHACASLLAGLTRGQIQKVQQDAGKWMGMAALLCDSAGWWPLATLYSNLSQVGCRCLVPACLPAAACSHGLPV